MCILKFVYTYSYTVIIVQIKYLCTLIAYLHRIRYMLYYLILYIHANHLYIYIMSIYSSFITYEVYSGKLVSN